jgi:monooxygenase
MRMVAEHVDVLIVGAGLSGVGAGCRLQQHCPGKTFAILEARDVIGGTWDLFRYPGVRSDSDMFTLCYPFRPWIGDRAIVDGPSILQYVRETAREGGIDSRIRFQHRVVRAAWSSDDSRWTVDVERGDTGETFQITCGFLFTCTGYYSYDEGYRPDFDGIEQFRGELVHPQFWNDEIDHTGKRVVVIGSGATAVTLVPAMAERAAHVTMLQRSPSYVISLPATDVIARQLYRVLPARIAYPIVRWKNVMVTIGIYTLSKRRPATAKRLLLKLARRQLPDGYEIDKHFTPRYDPWDESMCLVPDGDLFEAISGGRVSVVTHTNDRFTETAIVLTSGAELEADMVITATGLQMLPFGGIELSVDGEQVELPDTTVYRGAQLSDVPNMAFAFGYINQSWTLGADLACEQMCRMLNHMDRHGYSHVTPRLPAGESSSVPFAELGSGYIQRAIAQFPRQGTTDPWRRDQNYRRDLRTARRTPVDDPVLEFARAAGARRAGSLVA